MRMKPEEEENEEGEEENEEEGHQLFCIACFAFSCQLGFFSYERCSDMLQ